MKRKQVKKYVGECSKKFLRRLYIIIGIITISLSTIIVIQEIRHKAKYETLRTEIWEKVEEIMGDRHLEL